MKKIKLLVVAIIVAIGIQSCSTEETVSIDENFKKENGFPENAIVMTANAQSKSLNTLSTNNIHSCIRRMYVVYESSGFFSTDKDNLDYISELLKLQTFSTIVYTPHSICDGVYEWYVPCDEIPNDICNFRCQNMNLDADSAIHTRGAPVHERDRSSLAPDEEDDDPFCSRCPKDYSWVYSETPSCDEIKGSIRR